MGKYYIYSIFIASFQRMSKYCNFVFDDNFITVEQKTVKYTDVAN